MEALLLGLEESWRCATAVEYCVPGIRKLNLFQQLDERARSINRSGTGFTAIRLFDKLLVFRDWATAAVDKSFLDHISSFSFSLDGQKINMLVLFQFEPGSSTSSEVLTFIPRWGTLPRQVLQHEAKRIQDRYSLEAVVRSSKLLVSRACQVYHFKGYSFELPAGLRLKHESSDLLEFTYVGSLLEPQEAAERIKAEANRHDKAGVGCGNLEFIPVGPSLYVASVPQDNWVLLNWLDVNHQVKCWLSRKKKKGRYIMLRNKLFKFYPDQDKLFLSHGYLVDEALALKAATETGGIPVGIRPLCIFHDLSRAGCSKSEMQCKLDELTAHVIQGWVPMAALITPSGVVTVRPEGVDVQSDGCIDLNPVLPGCTIYLEDIRPQKYGDILSLLCDAVEDCNLELVKQCTSRLPTVNDVDDRKRMPMVLAARNGCMDIVMYLMEQGASVKLKDGNGVSPLLAATIERDDSLVKLFQEEGATCDYGKELFLARGEDNQYVLKGLEAAGYKCPIPSLGF